MQTKEKDNAFLFYPTRLSKEIADLNDTEVGMYFTLLLLGAEKGFITKEIMHLECGGIPTEDVLAKFILDDDGNYQIINTEILKN